ncbi:thiolase family protein [Frankia sp. AgB1.9]|uniref:thiolase family protein n=1 Tax=unclassified Frankia TaxID=2632575 RepID=UPI0019319976|nr:MULTISPECIES: thiolase family protein [unclassified Frankia]MBL7493525.1 thiolase family protein [Frankia sp. AgW1.1]MBL7551668.1 thiolase family protein [Frankia sp. AgB1.9]MBL7620204.1 thiolase family protein [Frankia sp. AgB1.8]
MAADSAGRHAVAIVGAGVSRSVRHSDVPIGSMAVSMSDAAIADAGLTRGDIDGISCGTSLPADGGARVLRPGYDFVNSDFLTETMGLEPVWSRDDGSFPPALARAVHAVAAGAASTVLVNRTVHNPAGRYHNFAGTAAAGRQQWTAPYGFVGWISGMAMSYLEYQRRYGARREHMATQVLQNRKNALRIPEAYWFGRELTFDEYMSSRMISEPLCLFDNDIPVDGGASFIVTTEERARDLPHKPVYITSWARIRGQRPSAWMVPGTLGALDDYYEPGFDLARRLWANSGWSPRDVDVVQLYDGFAMETWYWLEVLGFCPQGEAWSFVQDGRIAADGPFPLNSGGGNSGWGRLHGVPQVLECYLQLARRAAERQLARTETGLSTYGDPAHTIGTALLYSVDPTA